MKRVETVTESYTEEQFAQLQTVVLWENLRMYNVVSQDKTN